MSSFTNMLRRNQPSLDAEREAFQKNQMISMQKAMNSVESAAKEKHIRNILMGTHTEKAGKTFWQIASKLPIDSQPIVGWKFCHVLHKLMREGHDNALKESIKYHKNIKSLSEHWKLNSYGYGGLISLYLHALSARMDFHKKYETVPGTLEISEEEMESICGRDINNYFALCVDILECVETQLQLQQKVFSTLDMSKAVSLTGPGQCRLAPLIPMILDTSQLYDCSIKVLFKLHGSLPEDVLLGHRERFTRCHHGLRKFYHICSNLEYFKRLLLIPPVPDKVPDFFVLSDGRLGPIEMVNEDEVDGPPSPPREPSPEPSIGQLVDTTSVVSNEELFNIQPSTTQYSPPVPDHRDQTIEMLKAEIERLKAEIELMQNEHSSEVYGLMERIKYLEEELKNSQLIAENASSEIEEMRKSVVEAQKQAENAVKAQSLLVNVEKRATDSKKLYEKMKEKHNNLVEQHANLIRENMKTKQQTEKLQQNAGNLQSEKSQMNEQVEELKREIDAKKSEVDEAENNRRKQIKQLIKAAAEESHDVITRSVTSLDEEGAESRKCSAGSCLHVITQTQSCVERLQISLNLHQDETADDDVAATRELIQSLSSFGHWISSSIENGAATHNMASSTDSDLNQLCRSCGRVSLQFLEQLQNEDDESCCNVSQVQEKLEEMKKAAQLLLPCSSQDVDMVNVVEEEMASTTKAVEEAAARMEQLLNEAREKDEGVKLEVNEKILDACTDLMKMIRILIQSSRELQNEIVDTGRGASSPEDFYMKNSRWTEGLISAAKAVGWAASQLTDAGDNVFKGEGKLEDLIVCSHEISASTAQLVAASRVKASKRSDKLEKLEKASKQVNKATASVVAHTKDGRSRLHDVTDQIADEIDSFSKHQLRCKEMDIQVRVLELEKELEDERVKLGLLRKKQYEINEAEKEEEERRANAEKLLEQANTNTNNNTQEKPVVPPKPALE